MTFFKKSDIIVIFVLVATSALSWMAFRRANSGRSAKAEIYYKSELVKVVELDTGKEERFSIPQNNNVIFHLYPDGSIQFEESDCPDKICIKTGRLSIVGESAACLPNEIFLKIVPEGGYNQDDLEMIR